MSMSKKNFEMLLESVREAGAFRRGEGDFSAYRVHLPDEVDVKAIRRGFRLSQEQFANLFGFTLAAVREWEQGRRTPEASARVLLRIIAKEPDAVLRALERDAA